MGLDWSLVLFVIFDISLQLSLNFIIITSFTIFQRILLLIIIIIKHSHLMVKD